MSTKDYISILKQGKVRASEIKQIVHNVANQGKNERLTSSDAMKIIRKCVQDSNFRELYISDPIEACAQLGIKLVR